MNVRRWPTFVVVLLISSFAVAQELPSEPQSLKWHSDYGTAYADAKAQQRTLLVYFAPTREDSYAQQFESALSDATVETRLNSCVLLRVPTSYEVELHGERSRLLSHSAFAAMNGKAGLAIIDLRDEESTNYGHTVSAVPFQRIGYYAPSPASVTAVRTLLGLPPGNITQRTMVYAVRLHPEQPASTSGRAETYLFSEAAGHSADMARTGVQGHQGFDARFRRINSALGGSSAKEVVAESWPGEGLITACFSCVHSWRGSPGHWSAVSAAQHAFGYDIRRGSNGIWYATGLFTGK